MAAFLRQALGRASSALASASASCSFAAPAGALETQTRTLTSLLHFRGISQSSWAAQAAIPAASELPAAAAASAPAAPLPPWTPTRELRKRKVLPKRMQHLLTVRRVGAAWLGIFWWCCARCAAAGSRG